MKDSTAAKQLPGKIDFQAKFSDLKELPPQPTQSPVGFSSFLKNSASGFGRVMCLPATTAIIAGSGFLAILAFLFKIPAAAFLDAIGLKETSKKLLSDEEVGFFDKVVRKTYDFGIAGIGRDFGEASRSLRKIATSPLEDISHYEEYVDESTSSTKNYVDSFGKQHGLPSTSPQDPNGYQLYKSNPLIMTKA